MWLNCIPEQREKIITWNQTVFFYFVKKMEVRNKVVLILCKHDHLHSNVHRKINSSLISTSLGKNLFTWSGV